MLAVGRALMSRPKLMMLDEPSLGLAPLVVQDIFAIIREINRQGVTVLLIEQNANMALKIADLAYVLETGRHHHVRHRRGAAGQREGQGGLSRQAPIKSSRGERRKPLSFFAGGSPQPGRKNGWCPFFFSADLPERRMKCQNPETLSQNPFLPVKE